MALIFLLVALGAAYIHFQAPDISSGLLMPYLSTYGATAAGVQAAVTVLIVLAIILTFGRYVSAAVVRAVRGIIRQELKRIQAQYTLDVTMNDATLVSLAKLSAKFPNLSANMAQLNNLLELDPTRLTTILSLLDDETLQGIIRLDKQMEGLDLKHLLEQLKVLDHLPDLSALDLSDLPTDTDIDEVKRVVELLKGVDMVGFREALIALVNLPDTDDIQSFTEMPTETELANIVRFMETIKSIDLVDLHNGLLAFTELPLVDEIQRFDGIPTEDELKAIRLFVQLTEGINISELNEMFGEMSNIDLGSLPDLDDLPTVEKVQLLVQISQVLQTFNAGKLQQRLEALDGLDLSALAKLDDVTPQRAEALNALTNGSNAG